VTDHLSLIPVYRRREDDGGFRSTPRWTLHRKLLGVRTTRCGVFLGPNDPTGTRPQGEVTECKRCAR
jgi:hypothetical protein